MWTYHTCCLHSLRHTACIGLTPEHVTLEVLVPSVHNEGKCVHIPSYAHEGQETDTTLHQHLLFLFLHTVKRRIRSRLKILLYLSSVELSQKDYIHIFIIWYLQYRKGQSLAFSLMTARVVSAILSMTGVQSSLPVEDKRLSMAPFMMSMPEDKTQESLNSKTSVMTELLTVGRMCYDACMIQ